MADDSDMIAYFIFCTFTCLSPSPYLRTRPMKLIDWIWFKYFQFETPTYDATEKLGIVKLMFERIKIFINKFKSYLRGLWHECNFAATGGLSHCVCQQKNEPNAINGNASSNVMHIDNGFIYCLFGHWSIGTISKGRDGNGGAGQIKCMCPTRLDTRSENSFRKLSRKCIHSKK